MNKEYLGDSVYVEIGNGALVLTTENDGDPSNTIVLEQFVYDALVNYYQRAVEAYNQNKNEN